MGMQVVFYKVDHGRLCAWVAVPPKRKRFQGTTMASGRDVPHDLAQFVVEATLGLQHGFWGLLANGATFKSVPGRRRTQPGQQLIRVYRKWIGSFQMGFRYESENLVEGVWSRVARLGATTALRDGLCDSGLLAPPPREHCVPPTTPCRTG